VKRSLRILNILIVLALALSLFPLTALADDVPTNAVINPAGTPPAVEWKWELPDMQSGVAGIQYGTVANAHQHDDDMATPLMQVFPNLDDLPEARLIDYWWVVSDPNGIGDIIDAFIRVYHPAGDLKYQLHGTLQPCAALGTATTTGSTLEAAVHTGQLTAAQAALIVENCGKQIWRVYRVTGELSKHQPAGPYTVDASAVDQAGNTGSLSNQFTVLPIIGLRQDFTAIDFGQILPNTTKWVRGDFAFGGALPTVMNVGNVLMYINVQFTPMLGVNFQKVINVFDVMLDSTDNAVVDGQTYDPVNAGAVVCFDQEALGSNVEGQIDFSIHPGSIPGDTYLGRVNIWGTMSCPVP
jgi:hypothetical protein